MTNTGDDVPDDAVTRFEHLYAESLSALFGFCIRRCESREDAADLVAEVYLVAWRRIARMPHGQEARLWLFAVAHRLLANQERALRRQRNLGARLAQHCADSHAPDPAEFLDRREAARVLHDALATLSPQDSALITLTAWEGLSVADAGRVIGLTAGAARVRLHRARGRLRRALTAAQAPVEPVARDAADAAVFWPALSHATVSRPEED
ncbi:RNA polymerase sigma factor [Actinocrinis puniceicyclus]|uniref:RNA polymerase sigma factor n=1 Tax=Actinocrinis puniceicyclus TaxID=977794 RepID=A0A8J8BF66_9ACTN|nr:RNA polymerase sigma factor [Actinocrinis puniceicyclus]MBS2965871.1 RNA polymerase sigma factor [Actinocrinis puniceicyclus]